MKTDENQVKRERARESSKEINTLKIPLAYTRKNILIPVTKIPEIHPSLYLYTTHFLFKKTHTQIKRRKYKQI